MSATADKLREARKLIEDPERWTRGSLARNAAGTRVAPADPEACRWCAEGALRARDGWWSGGPGEALRSASYVCSGTRRVATVNDDRGHEAVLEMYDRAIELAEQS